MAAKTDSPIYLITDGAVLRKSGKLLHTIAVALESAAGKVGFVQIREQVFGSNSIASDRELLDLSKEIYTICFHCNAKCIINSRIDIALKLKLNGLNVGVHLGKHSSTITDARSTLGDDAIIGYSAHSKKEALNTLEAPLDKKADYVFLSPIFLPLSKQSSQPPLGISVLGSLCAESNSMVFALGGITTKNAMDCKKAGASGIATISTIMHAKDPKIAIKELIHSWNGH